MEKRFLESAKACLASGDRLLSDAETLSYDQSPTSLALAIFAEEEFAKGFLLFLVETGVIPWNTAILRVTRDHSCKHLLGLLMEYANPDFDEMRARFDRWHNRHLEIMRLLEELKNLPSFAQISDRTERAVLRERQRHLWSEIGRLEQENNDDDSLPNYVADTINILRYEKIWRSDWSSEENGDRTAHLIAKGARDRERQDAIYVRIGKMGQVVNLPHRFSQASMARARERAKQLRSLLSSVIENEGLGYREFESLIEVLKIMFADPEELARLFPDTENPYPMAVGRRGSSPQPSLTSQGNGRAQNG